MPELPRDNKEYKNQSYWDSRFASEESYDWLARYNDVADLIAQYVPKSSRLLIVGCGNSTFSVDLYDAGYTNIVNLDFSSVVIERMSGKYTESRPLMRWVVGDMLKLPESFDASSFDVVIDKAAMDALMVEGGDTWSPAEHLLAQAHDMCTGVQKVLTPTGLFIQISFGQPHFRKRFLLGDAPQADVSTAYGWTYKYHNIPIGLGYFFFVMQK
ncbi:hypothetical protein SPRG_18855 [Saprolegnia parasitica CBS 223.65]|uniref:Methyltransferase domain-containing protein n=1 Tax=Saprolegnia parasitica (strain CBS 223.65) TaxID=695850 RepID=A0A067DAS5_SAPPC|nr:hypothetical protein SPRG_18855 [Saprolegnia parasitica CBS 223.65]KDO35701.1 hypothetical protein SPRG_18855 [Saprolegnia parasitica CBS 223.65]|eukprot:XP_012194071.1 hypothetical protein SPRG_18855 [Saprolegnia parasitica CBS 223.65]